MTYVAVFAQFVIDNRMFVFHIYSPVRAVIYAVFTGDAGRPADLCLILIIGCGTARNLLLSCVRNYRDDVLRAGICTVFAAHAFFRIYYSSSVDYVNSVIPADFCTASKAAAACR